MNVDKLCKAQDTLMERWRKASEDSADSASFIADGIVNPEVWVQQDTRILFLLKEAYVSGNYDFSSDRDSLTSWLFSNDISGYTYNHVAEWTQGIIAASQGNQLEFDSWLGVEGRNRKIYDKERSELLQKIAVVNIKKYGGVRQSGIDDLYYHCIKHADLLREQIELANPTVIVCGGTFGMLRCLYLMMPQPKKNEYGIKFNDRSIIQAPHPNSRISAEDNFKLVVDAYLKASQEELYAF